MSEKEQKFSLDDAVSAAWSVMLAKFWPYLGLLSLASFLSVLPFLASTVCQMNPDWWALGLLFSVLGAVVHVLAGLLGMTYVQIRIVRDKTVSSDDIWGAIGSFFPFIAATLFYGWVVCFGLCLFIVPGIIFGIMFRFYSHFMAEHKLGPIGALKASAAITSGAMWELFFLHLILGILKMFAPLAFLVGAVPAHMFSELAITEAYKILLDKTPSEELPFSYVRSADIYENMPLEESVDFAHSTSAASMLAFDQHTAPDETIQLPPEKETVEEPSTAVDNNIGENDKSSQEH